MASKPASANVRVEEHLTILIEFLPATQHVLVASERIHATSGGARVRDGL